MHERPCRDCGYLLDAEARGCPRCALNVEAERMIERVVAGVMGFGLIIIASAAAVIYIVVR